MNLAVVGVGKTGMHVVAAAQSRGHGVVAQIRSANAADIEKLASHDCDAAIVFTPPAIAPDVVRTLTAAGIPTVVGTTGWYQALESVRAFVLAQKGKMLYAANFSIGVQIFLDLARELSRRMNAHASFDPYIEERHHRRKLDAPSGTAQLLAQTVLSELERKKSFGPCGDAPSPDWLSVASTRAGDIVGVHRLSFVSQSEEISIVHEARDRSCFADGAIFAAEWLVAREPGVYTFADCFA
jgi:4-hydroxy-tetrahydrodipicolinate reductase